MFQVNTTTLIKEISKKVPLLLTANQSKMYSSMNNIEKPNHHYNEEINNKTTSCKMSNTNGQHNNEENGVCTAEITPASSTTPIINCIKLELLDTAITAAAKELAESNVIALPTDTVYGLACCANNRLAIQKLYQIKGRNESKPVAICVATIQDLRRYGEADHLPDSLLKQLLPGAVTIVLNRTKHLHNPDLNRGISRIGIRIPDFPFIQKLCARYGLPIALTSANRSSEKSTLNISEFDELWPQLGSVFDGGKLGLTDEQRAASTVIDLSKPGLFKIIRNGVAVRQTISIIEKFQIFLDPSGE